MNQGLDELIEKRKGLIASAKENNFHFEKLVSELYSQADHFILELLQNAEDAGATEVELILSDSSFVVKHNSKNLFSFDDVDRITTVGSSSKIDDMTKIGRFGVGFKAVFSITDKPEVHSGSYHFAIEKMLLPIKLKGSYSSNTIVSLPFRSGNEKTFCSLIQKSMKDFAFENLLYLSNIERITLNSADVDCCISRTSKTIETISNDRNISEITISDSSSEKVFILLENKIRVTEDELFVTAGNQASTLKTCICFAKKNGEIVRDTSLPDISAYFPLKVSTGFIFGLQAPFKTNPARETVYESDKTNESLFEILYDSFKDIVLWIAKEKLLTIDLWRELPTQHNKFTIRKDTSIEGRINDVLIQILKENHPVIPSNSNTLVKPSEVVSMRETYLPELVNKELISNVFPGKLYWTSEDLSGERDDLRDYFRKHGKIEYLTIDSFCTRITPNLIKGQPISWYKKFYERLKNAQYLWYKTKQNPSPPLKDKSYVLCADNELRPALKTDGSPLVYRATNYETDSSKCIHPDILSVPELDDFFHNMGIKKYTYSSLVLDEHLPRLTKGDLESLPTKDYLTILNDIFDAWKEDSSEGNSEWLYQLKNIAFIKSVSNEGQTEFNLPSRIYLRTPNLTTLFKNQNLLWFLCPELTSLINKNELFEQFLLALGVRDSLKLERINLGWHDDLKKRRLWESNLDTVETRSPLIKDFQFSDLVIPNEIDYQYTQAIFNELATLIKNRGWPHATIHWKYHKNHTQEIGSQIEELLKSHSWINFENNNFRPSMLNIDQIKSAGYDVSADLEKMLIDYLGIRPSNQKSAIDFLTEEELMKLELVRNLSLEELRAFTPRNSDEKSDEDFEQHEVEFNPDTIEYETLSGQLPQVAAVSPEGSTSNSDENITIAKSHRSNENTKSHEHHGDILKNKKQGRSAEILAIRWIRDNLYKGVEFNEKNHSWKGTTDEGKVVRISDMNFFATSTGYDIEIQENNHITHLIEVKSKNSTKKTFVSLSYNQWALSRKDKPYKYSVLVICIENEKKSSIRLIEEPYKKWVANELKADPVNIEV